MAEWREEEWELYNDGVLIYKRKKRRFAVSQPPPPPPPPPSESQPDPEAEEKNRRARKRRALVKLKDKYQKELDQWDNLSNTLHALEERAQQQQTLRLQEQEQEQEREEEDQALSAASPSGSSLVQRSMVDELLLKVEAEESIIHDFSNLCDISEALCDVQEEQLNQSLFDLPIWGSPRTLMASLCDGLED